MTTMSKFGPSESLKSANNALENATAVIARIIKEMFFVWVNIVLIIQCNPKWSLKVTDPQDSSEFVPSKGGKIKEIKQELGILLRSFISIKLL